MKWEYRDYLVGAILFGTLLLLDSVAIKYLFF